MVADTMRKASTSSTCMDLVLHGNPPPVKKAKTTPTGNKLFLRMETKTQKGSVKSHQYFKLLKIYLPIAFPYLMDLFEYFCGAPKHKLGSEISQLFKYNFWFGGKPLVFTTNRSQHIALRHYDKKDNNNLPFSKFVEPLNGNPTIENMETIRQKDKAMMNKIRNTTNHTEASELIKKFMESSAETTKRLIHSRASLIEKFIKDSLPNFIGYICQELNDSKTAVDSENSIDSKDLPQKYSLSLVFKVTRTFSGKQLEGALILPILAKIIEVVCDGRRNRQVVYAWIPGTAYIKPIGYLDGLIQGTFFKHMSS